jgi:hypothetical protein
MIPTAAAELFTVSGPTNDGLSGDADAFDPAPDEFGDWWLDLGFVALPPAAGGV